MHSNKFLRYFSGIAASLTCLVFVIATFAFIQTPHSVELYALRLCLLIGGVIASSTALVLSLSNPLRSLRILTAFYYVVGAATAFFYGNTLTISLVAFSICVVIGSLSFGRRFSLIGAIASIATLYGVYWFVIDRMSDPYAYDTLITQSLLIAIVALFCWHSLRVADTYYRKFGKKLDDLSKRIEMYETRLAKENREELVMLYKFADAGRKSVAVLHNLANHLTLMALDDNGRYRQSYEELNKLMADAYASLRPVKPTAFDPCELLAKETIPALHDIASLHNVTIECTQEETADKAQLHGDRFQLGLAITILVHNAIDSYRHASMKNKRVIVKLDRQRDTYIITVDDYGPGISKGVRKKLFQCTSPTDSNCHGIGLFTAREITASHFGGQLTLDARRDITRFKISIPLKPTTSQKESATAQD